ncbi:hypothetical protein B7463_g3565, partial [Scytalidium lignicola]
MTDCVSSPKTSSHTIPKPFKVQEHMRHRAPRVFSPQNPPEKATVSSTLDVPETNLSPPALAVPLNTDSSNIEVIPDLCKALRMSKGTLCLGYLGNEDNSHNCLQLFCEKSATITVASPKSTKTLKELLDLSPIIFSRSDKALVALTLAKAVLQLHTTQ